MNFGTFYLVIMVLLLNYQISTTVGDNNTLSNSIFNYEATWESLDSRPLPLWYDQSKIGIFVHWGVYCVPGFGNEWFWNNWKRQKIPELIEFMEKNYKPGFTYQEFAQDFTGEHFNPNDWVDLFKKSGVKYVVLTSKHHEGFTMWPSTHSFGWNSADVGLHRDVVGELAEAIRKNSTLRFGLYYSLFEWFNLFYINDKLHLFLINNFATQKVLPELKEIVNLYNPELIWSDGDFEAIDKYWGSKEFLSWLYNESPVRESVVTNDRWGIGTACTHGGYYTCHDHYNPGTLQDHKFENALTIDKYSWGHRNNAKLSDYLTTKELIDELVTTVCCGGNILINVGPNKYGIIEPIYEERLLQMGEWLTLNGESIYKTIPWKYQKDSQADGVWYSTRKFKQRRAIYAIVLQYPYTTSGVNLYSLGNDLLDEKSKVRLLGYNNILVYYKSKESVYVKFPDKQYLDAAGLKYAWVLKIDVPL